jgi:hypothetical protein
VPTKVTHEVLKRIDQLEEKFTTHLTESGTIKTDLLWLKWINMGIAALVLFKLVADWIK